MAHQLYTPEQAARSSIAALRHLTVLPRTVRQDFSSEFVAGRGQTVNVLRPARLSTENGSQEEARVYTPENRASRDAIVFDEIAQEYAPITLDEQIYKAVRLPDDFMTFTLTDMENNVLRPMAESVVDRLTKPLVDVMSAVDTDESIDAVAADGSNVRQVLIQARRVLNSRRVPTIGRTIAVGPGVEAAFLQDELLQKANESGTTGLLREATIGRLFGFDIVVDAALPDDYAVAYDREAFAHVTRPSRAPEGAGFSATRSQDGFALRYLQHYNPLQLEDQAVLDAFAGADVLDERRAVSFSLAGDATP